jgi:hypothetical protein
MESAIVGFGQTHLVRVRMINFIQSKYRREFLVDECFDDIFDRLIRPALKGFL